MRSKKRIKPFLKFIEKEWLKSQDQRFGQFLINQGIVPFSQITWNLEMSDYNIPHEVMRDIQTWGTYSKKENSKIKEVFIKDLETDHIKSILKTQKHISKELRDFLKKEIKYRKV